MIAGPAPRKNSRAAGKVCGRMFFDIPVEKHLAAIAAKRMWQAAKGLLR
jgi:hypothetical protein